MTIVFRQLHAGDREEYLTLMLAAYKPIYALGIPFDAATATLEKVTQHIAEHGVYAVFSEGVMRASVTIRYPWGPIPGPFGVPHFGWFGAHPNYKDRRWGREIQEWVEQNILIDKLKAPAVSLGTAVTHPWLKQMYERRGFESIHEVHIGTGHNIVFMKKILEKSS
jgi:hypothetical protein